MYFCLLVGMTISKNGIGYAGFNIFFFSNCQGGMFSLKEDIFIHF